MHPPEDPTDLTSHAGVMRRLAENTNGVADHLEREVAATTFEGPSARRLRVGMVERTRRLRVAAAQLEDLADIIVLDRPNAGG